MFTESWVKREGEASSDYFDLKTEFPQTTCLSCDVKIVLSTKSSVIERSSEFDYRSFVNRTFDCVRLAKFYCEFDYRIYSIERRPRMSAAFGINLF